MTASRWLPIEIALTLFILVLAFSLIDGLEKFIDTYSAVTFCVVAGVGFCATQLFLSARVILVERTWWIFAIGILAPLILIILFGMAAPA